MRARYNRISSPNQKLERQLIRNHPDEEIYNDVISGTVSFNERPQGKELFKAVEEGKITFVSVAALDRMGRNLQDLINTIEFFNSHNVILRIDNLGIESMVNGKPNPIFKLIATVLGNVAEMERTNLRERQLEGIAVAKAKGIYTGRVRGSSMSEEDFLNKHKAVVKEIKANPNLSLRKLAKLGDVSLGTIQRIKKVLVTD